MPLGITSKHDKRRTTPSSD